MSVKKKVFLYGRVGTDQQTGGLESQLRALKEYCAMNKIVDYEIFTDEGISGTKSNRPALDRMMAAIRNGECSCLVVYSFSRFARSVTHLLNGLEELKKQQTGFVMHMADWVKKLDGFLRFNEKNILAHAGKISHQMALDHAEKEFEKFEDQRRKIEATEPTSDFDKIAKQFSAKKPGKKP